MGQDTSTDEAKLLILDAVTSADSLAGIVDNLIELSRYQSDRLSLQSAPADVSEIASEVVKRLQAKSPLHHLAVDVSADVPPANVDRVRIERVIYNLVENAIKYSPGGGEVRVRGRRDDGHIVVGVSDEGIGISEEDQARLFRSFERIDAYQKYSIPGLGLGLRVCRILIEAHGGRIWVESAKGVGSTFLFTVPIAEGTQKAAESTG
jgi:signal transduction histidine kinase